MKLTGAAILASRGMKVLQAVPAAYPYRSAAEEISVVPVIAPRFDLDECDNEAERTFIEAMHARAEAGGWFADVWRVRPDCITLSVCPADDDPKYNCVLRALRVDFDGSTVWFGPDETYQFVTELDPGRRGVYVQSGLPVGALANAAADWFEREMRRPIARHEWDRLDSRGVAPRLWVLADTGEGLVEQGRPPRDIPPDRVVPVK
jgi:hypothetical protein